MLTSPSPKPNSPFPSSIIKTQNLDSPATAATDCHHHRSLPLHLLVFLAVLCDSFSVCYCFQLKIKLHTQSLGTLAFLFLFSQNLSFSIETKQRKGSLLNDANRGDSINLMVFFVCVFMKGLRVSLVINLFG